MPRPRVLAALPGFFPSTVINVAKPLMRLVEEGAIDLDLTAHFATRRRQIEGADVLVMSHTIDPAHAWILDCARQSGTPLVYDIDENLLEPPDDVPGLQFHRAPGRQAAVRQALAQAAVVRTYAPALQRYLRAYNANVVRTEGPIDWRLVPADAPPRRSDRVRIVYATSRQGQDTIGAMIVDPLRKMLDAHAHVDVTIWGPRFAALDGHPRVEHRAFIREYDRYFGEFARAGFDIGLAPMPGDAFYQSKTATKFREYAACRIAGIYADVEIYRDCVTDGETGLVVNHSGGPCPPVALRDEAWIAAMERLIRDAPLRARIRAQAERAARERYSAERISRDWLSHIEAAAASRRAAARGPEPLADQSRTPRIARIGEYSRRAVSLVRSDGVSALWSRLRAELADRRQLAEWELALRQIRRQQHL